jgi:hypothetical protein
MVVAQTYKNTFSLHWKLGGFRYNMLRHLSSFALHFNRRNVTRKTFGLILLHIFCSTLYKRCANPPLNLNLSTNLMMNLQSRYEKDVDENNKKRIKISCYREKKRDNNFADPSI